MKPLFLVLALSACTAVPSSIPIFLSAERISPETIRLTLDNGSSQPVGYNLCTSALERRSTSGWTRVPVDEVCTMELRTLNPGHDATYEKRLPSGLDAGEYRYVNGIESPAGGERVIVATDPFDIR